MIGHQNPCSQTTRPGRFERQKTGSNQLAQILIGESGLILAKIARNEITRAGVAPSAAL
jgi:hypothetical protein